MDQSHIRGINPNEGVKVAPKHLITFFTTLVSTKTSEAPFRQTRLPVNLMTSEGVAVNN